MATLVLDCPHCGSKKTAFSTWGVQHHAMRQEEMSITASCAACGNSVLVVMASDGGARWSPLSEPIDLMNHPKLRFLSLWPQQLPIEVPMYVPDAVAAVFLEAAHNRKDSRNSSACIMYRRAMEIGLKTFSPDVDAWKLEKRIDKLASEHRITPELQIWAHSLRLDGNEMVHGDTQATHDLTEQMHHLCWFLLTYLYTLPKQVELATTNRVARAASRG